jgi:hypothetical protein
MQMKNLNFDDGYKTYSINGDESKVIRVNVTDFNLLKRLEEAQDNIERELARYGDIEINPDGSSANEDTISLVAYMDAYIKKQIDYIFDSDISSVVFGNSSCLSMSGGEMFFARFLDAIVPEIEAAVKEEQKASQKRVSKYTKAAQSVKKSGKKK